VVVVVELVVGARVVVVVEVVGGPTVVVGAVEFGEATVELEAGASTVAGFTAVRGVMLVRTWPPAERSSTMA
jgi:hypothetical protein